MRPCQLTEDDFLAAQKLHRGWKPMIAVVAVAGAYAAYVFLSVDPVTAAIYSGVVLLFKKVQVECTHVREL